MCGIFYFLTLKNRLGYGSHDRKISLELLKTLQHEFSFMAHRGPDNSIFVNDGNRCFGFHRLAINGLNSESNQPFLMKNCRLICNGEIYNYKDLIKEFELENEYKSGSDCEIIIHLYKKIGIEETLKKLDGVFAFVLVDYDIQTTFVARDPVGVRSLFIGNVNGYDSGFSVASEMKSLQHCSVDSIMQFPAGCYCVYNENETINIKLNFRSYYENVSIIQRDIIKNYYDMNVGGFLHINTEIESNYHYNIIEDNEENICENIRNLFTDAVKKRLMSDRSVGALVSGGLDSSSAAAIMCKFIDPSKLNTYSIGLEGSVDLYWARKTAEYLGTKHHEVCLTEAEFLNEIRNTIYQIESYCTTSVRASLPNYIVSKYIFKVSDDVVIYCGDMSDEIFGSYRGFLKATDNESFKKENERMVRDVRYFDLLRSDKSISGAGLEARVPFADKKFLQYVMSIPPHYKRFDDEKIEKYLFRKAFDGLLPENILWRRKEAFSDGVSGHGRSWFQVIKEYIDTIVSDEEYEKNKHKYDYHNPPYDKESYYYRKVFEEFYPGRARTIPYYWRHPFCTDLDPSARLLSFYKAE